MSLEGASVVPVDIAIQNQTLLAAQPEIFSLKAEGVIPVMRRKALAKYWELQKPVCKAISKIDLL